MALVLFIVKPSSAQGEGGSVGRMGGREAEVFDSFCLGPLHAPTPGRVQQRLPAALPHARTHTGTFSCMGGSLEYRNWGAQPSVVLGVPLGRTN